MIWKEKKKTEAERQEATENADAAHQVVDDLSGYVELLESGSGAVAVTDAEQASVASASPWPATSTCSPFCRKTRRIRWHVALMHRSHANLNRSLARNAEAEVSYHEAIRLSNQLVADYPENKEYREENAFALRDYGDYLQWLGRYQEGTEMADDAARLFEKLTIADPDAPNYKRFLADLLMERADGEYQFGAAGRVGKGGSQVGEGCTPSWPKRPGTQSEPVDPLFHAMAYHNLAMTLRERRGASTMRWPPMIGRLNASRG